MPAPKLSLFIAGLWNNPGHHQWPECVEQHLTSRPKSPDSSFDPVDVDDQSLLHVFQVLSALAGVAHVCCLAQSIELEKQLPDIPPQLPLAAILPFLAICSGLQTLGS